LFICFCLLDPLLCRQQKRRAPRRDELLDVNG
jgi:hypothetical protein